MTMREARAVLIRKIRKHPQRGAAIIALASIGAGSLFSFAMMYGPGWWRFFYHYQTLVAGMGALIAAWVAWEAAQRQIAANQLIHDQQNANAKEAEYLRVRAELETLAATLERQVDRPREDRDMGAIRPLQDQLKPFTSFLAPHLSGSEYNILQVLILLICNLSDRPDPYVMVTIDGRALRFELRHVPYVLQSWASGMSYMQKHTLAQRVRAAPSSQWLDEIQQ